MNCPMKRGFCLLLLLLLVTGCHKNSYKTYSTKYRVWYSCNIMDAPFNQVTTPGRFISIRRAGNTLKTVDSDGHTTDIELSAVQSGSYIMGLAGLIVGTPTFNNDDLSVWAYDLGCPECDQSQTRLSFDVNGTARCSKCNGIWNLNSSGIPVNSDGKENRPLYRYPVTLNNGIITVQN